MFYTISFRAAWTSSVVAIFDDSLTGTGAKFYHHCFV